MFNFDLTLCVVWLVLFALAFCGHAAKHGRPITGNYNIFSVIVFWAIPVYLVVKAYFINYPC